jgi:hypothetical protein
MSATFTYQGVKQTWYDAAMSLWAGEFSGWSSTGTTASSGSRRISSSTDLGTVDVSAAVQRRRLD